jgi:hypothetical protein
MNQYIEIKEFARDYSKLNRQTYRLGAQPIPVSVATAGNLSPASSQRDGVKR